MTTEMIRFGLWGTMLGLVWMTVVFVLLWISPSERQVPRKEVIVRYIFTLFLLFVLQITALSITFLLHSSRESAYTELTPQHPHAKQPSN
jgi:heme A synthase